MLTFQDLKGAYISAIQFGMLNGANYDNSKHCNEWLNHFCKGMVDSSNYNNNDKHPMKQELDFTKETLSIKIDNSYKNNRS